MKELLVGGLLAEEVYEIKFGTNLVYQLDLIFENLESDISQLTQQCYG
jgi:hypothetical protein